MICLLTDTIDDLILYLENEEEHVLDFKIKILMLISLMITRLNFKKPKEKKYKKSTQENYM